MQRLMKSTRTNFFGVSAALVAAILAASLLVLASPAEVAFLVANGKIAFESNRDANSEIYVMNADGSNPTNLTNLSSPDHRNPN